MKTKFVKRIPVADNIYRYQFETERPIKQTAGQFTELTIKHVNPDDRGIKRWFTVSSAPGTSYLEITTRFMPDSSSSFKKALNSLKTGQEVEAAEPMGDFVLPIDKSLQLLFVAGGIGITPYLSILSHLLETNENRDISLLYAVKNESEALDITNLKKLLSSYELLTGRLTSDLILQEANKLESPQIYISGPEKMVEVLTKEVVGGGIDSSRVVGDYFPGYDS